MKDYDFKALNDREFERLALDLLSQREKTTIERFKPGKDGGVDGRFHSFGTVIVQVKHYANTGYNGLLSKLKNEEANKVKKLNPKRYILITSVGLTPPNKEEIRKIFHPYIINTNDIIGLEGVNDLIVLNPTIERNCYKLWLSSSNILIELLHNSAIQKRNFLIEDAIKESHKFIETQQLKKAIEILDTNNVVIITGLPGVGKTTLAKQIVLIYCGKDYDVYHIEDSISEVESVYLKEKKQFFYFDDFLGANYLEIFSGNSDSKIFNFIKRIISDKNKKLVLTSRTNILNRAKALSDVFKFGKIEKKELEINVSDLSDIEKADILYNHIWHGLLPEDYSDVFYKDRNYWKVINHKNFNPRLISFVTDGDRILGIDKSDYWTYILDALNNPEIIWSHCFYNQTPEEILDLVCLVVFNMNNIEESDCKDALRRVFKVKYASEYHVKFNKIDDYIKESLKSTLNRTLITYGKNKFLTRLMPFNPSISDYIINRFSKNEVALILYFTALKTTVSINSLFAISHNGKIDENTLVMILYAILEDVKKGRLDAYAVHLYLAIIESNLSGNHKMKMVTPNIFLNIDEEYLTYDSEVGECILWAIAKEPNIFSEQFIIAFINYALRSNRKHTLKHEDYLPLSKLTELYPSIRDQESVIELMNDIKEYWHDNFDEHLSDSGKIQDLDYDDRSTAENIAFNMLWDIISEYNLPFKDNDVEYMFDNVDVTTHFNDEPYQYNNDDEKKSFRNFQNEKGNSISYIDDLFKK